MSSLTINWNSVEEDKPKENTSVLVNDGHVITEAYYGCNGFTSASYVTDTLRPLINPIKYWIELDQ